MGKRTNKTRTNLRLAYVLLLLVAVIFSSIAITYSTLTTSSRAQEKGGQKQSWLDFINVFLPSSPAPQAPDKPPPANSDPEPTAEPEVEKAPVTDGGKACDILHADAGTCTCSAPRWVSYMCFVPIPGEPDPRDLVGPRAWQNPGSDGYSESEGKDGCQKWCVEKPVVYLYPPTPTFVDVEVVSPGRVYISDPLYPDGGWKRVLAHPDGMLEYHGRVYGQLYYETEITSKIQTQEAGILIPTAQVESRLGEIINELGLIGREHKDFLEYWVPKLKGLDAQYVFFTVLEQNEKERIDHLEINPKPDTFIGFIAYFRPVDRFYTPPVLELPPPPARRGFTAVEWGGIIEK